MNNQLNCIAVNMNNFFDIQSNGFSIDKSYNIIKINLNKTISTCNELYYIPVTLQIGPSPEIVRILLFKILVLNILSMEIYINHRFYKRMADIHTNLQLHQHCIPLNTDFVCKYPSDSYVQI